MEFLKTLFGEEALTYDQLAEKVKGKEMKIADLSGGQYVSREKFDSLQNEKNALQGDLDNAKESISALTADVEKAQKLGADAEAVQKQLTETLQAKEEAETKWAEERKQIEQQYAHDKAVADHMSGLEFASASARRGYEADFRAAGLPLKDGRFLGADDFVKDYKANDPNTFPDPDKPVHNPPTGPLNNDPVPPKEPKNLYEALTEKFSKKGD